MTEPDSLPDTVRSLDRDEAVTITTLDGTTYDARVKRTQELHSGEAFLTTLWDDNYNHSELRLDTFEGLTLTYSPSDADQELTVTDLTTHGIEVDLDEPVRNEGYPKKVASCAECGGLMRLVWGDMKQSFDYYECRECEHEDTFRPSDDAVRNPTRREWVALRLANTNPFSTVPERYLTEEQTPNGYYYRERCPEGHYQQCTTNATTGPRADNHDAENIQHCPECGQKLKHQIETYERGREKWGEPEDIGTGVPDEVTEAIEAVETGTVALHIATPAIQYGEGEVYVIKKPDGRLYVDIVGAGGMSLDADGMGRGRIAYWYTQADEDDAALVPHAEYTAEASASA